MLWFTTNTLNAFMKNTRYTWKENNEKFVNDSAAVVEELNEDLKKQLYLHQNKKIINYLRTFFSESLI